MNTAIATRSLWSILAGWIRNRFSLSFELKGLEFSEEDVLADLATGSE